LFVRAIERKGCENGPFIPFDWVECEILWSPKCAFGTRVKGRVSQGDTLWVPVKGDVWDRSGLFLNN